MNLVLWDCSRNSYEILQVWCFTCLKNHFQDSTRLTFGILQEHHMKFRKHVIWNSTRISSGILKDSKRNACEIPQQLLLAFFLWSINRILGRTNHIIQAVYKTFPTTRTTNFKTLMKMVAGLRKRPNWHQLFDCFAK